MYISIYINIYYDCIHIFVYAWVFISGIPIIFPQFSKCEDFMSAFLMSSFNLPYIIEFLS